MTVKKKLKMEGQVLAAAYQRLQLRMRETGVQLYPLEGTDPTDGFVNQCAANGNHHVLHYKTGEKLVLDSTKPLLVCTFPFTNENFRENTESTYKEVVKKIRALRIAIDKNNLLVSRAPIVFLGCTKLMVKNFVEHFSGKDFEVWFLGKEQGTDHAMIHEPENDASQQSIGVQTVKARYNYSEDSLATLHYVDKNYEFHDTKQTRLRVPHFQHLDLSTYRKHHGGAGQDFSASSAVGVSDLEKVESGHVIPLLMGRNIGLYQWRIGRTSTGGAILIPQKRILLEEKEKDKPQAQDDKKNQYFHSQL